MTEILALKKLDYELNNLVLSNWNFRKGYPSYSKMTVHRMSIAVF